MTIPLYDIDGPMPTMRAVVLEKIRLAVSKSVDPSVLDMMRVDSKEDVISRAIIFDLRMCMAGQKLQEIRKGYPADWWQAFRERWFPEWWLRYWPVKYTEIHIRIDALYPKIELPEEDHFITVYVLEWPDQKQPKKVLRR